MFRFPRRSPRQIEREIDDELAFHIDMVASEIEAEGVPAREARNRALRTAFDLNPPNWLYDGMVGSPLFAHLARTVFFHHRGLLSAQAWHDLLLGWQ